MQCCSEYLGLLVVFTVRALLSLQQAWGGDTLLWTGSDPCAGGWLGILCDESKTRVISL